MKELSLTLTEINGLKNAVVPRISAHLENIHQKSAVRDRTTIFVHVVENQVYYKLISLHERAISNANRDITTKMGKNMPNKHICQKSAIRDGTTKFAQLVGWEVSYKFIPMH